MAWRGKAPPIGHMRNYAGLFEWRDVPQVGGPSVHPGYVFVEYCWCSLKTKGAGEIMIGDAAVAERGTHVIFTRFREGLTTRHMFEISSIAGAEAGKRYRRYRVVAVNNDDARRFTQLDVEEYGDATTIGIGPPIPLALDEMDA